MRYHAKALRILTHVCLMYIHTYVHRFHNKTIGRPEKSFKREYRRWNGVQ